MIFSQAEIDLAKQFKLLGLPWTPHVGHYVYDAEGQVKPGSPFQNGVYFLLNYDCFMERVGGVERFQKVMTWLPTWSDARSILRDLGMSDSAQQEQLQEANAIATGKELLCLYRWIEERLLAHQQSHTVPTESSPAE